ncbi:hypothetical protein M3175_01505 [Robertmurraya korlensis]|uniref:phage tail terminator family protein n=1 Tax=Robertmurraya korlensis TaxID=519977 RepID=UPI00203D8E83|nr:hypothetical protein [Robertmurraya korlensis]MCM3599391.1 hypothetical protein [Robertmurraya korlensis]
MVKIKDSIVKVLSDTFTDHQVYDEKKTQGLKRPCFFVDIIPVAFEKPTPNQQERSIIVDVQYMSLEETKEENLVMSEELGQMFSVISFDTYKIKPSEERYEIVDGILHYLFDLDFTVYGTQEDSTPMIGQVNLTKEVN